MAIERERGWREERGRGKFVGMSVAGEEDGRKREERRRGGGGSSSGGGRVHGNRERHRET